MTIPSARFPMKRAVALLTAIAAILFTSVAQAAGAAPDWTLKTPEGKEVSSSELKGKLVVVDFWATWCGPCVQEIPGYVDLQKKYGEKGLAVVGISLDRGGPERVKRFMKEHGINYTIVMGNDEIADKFGGIEGIPTTFLIGRDGSIVHTKTGAWDHHRYEELVKKHL